MQEAVRPEGEQVPIVEVASAYRELAKDFRQCTRAFEANPESQFWRRTTVHTLFASTEVATHFIKQWLLHGYYRIGIIELSLPEIAVLKEESYGLKNNGTLDVKKAKLRTADNFRFALSLFHEKAKTGHQLDVGGNGWQSYLKTLKMRDRITHPKSFSDITITDTECETIATSAIFIGDSYVTFAELSELALDAATREYSDKNR